VAADVAVPYFRGSSTHVYEVAKNLSTLGHEVHVVARRAGPSQPKEENLDGVSIHRCRRGILFSLRRSGFADLHSKGSYRGTTPLLVWKSYEAYLRTAFPMYIATVVTSLVKKNSIDLIFERETSFGAGAIASLITGRPFVLEVIGNRVTGLQVRRSRKIVAYSRDMFEGTRYMSKVELVTGAVDSEAFRPDPVAGAAIRAKYSIVGSPVVGFVGTFQEWQGLDDLIGAARDVLRSRPNTKFLMVGPYYDETEAKVASAGMAESFLFTGPVPYDQVSGYMNAADVLVAPYNPSRIQSAEQTRKYGLGAPLKVFEYMSVGKPAITTDIGQISDAVEDGVNGYLVPPGAPDRLGSTILKVLRDRKEAERVGKAARERVVSDYSWSLVAKRLSGIFEAVIASGRSRAS
jgi:glycosyltransferase involved in cell wall biosynthesis